MKLSLTPAQIAFLQFQRSCRDAVRLVFPDHCQLCEAEVRQGGFGGVCRTCLATVPVVKNACLRCGFPLPEVVGLRESCRHCEKLHRSVRRVYAMGAYGQTLRKAVVLMKQPGSEAVATSLGNRMAVWFDRVRDEISCYDVVVSTPKHWFRRILRRHNSADLLAEVVAKKIDSGLALHAIERIKATSKQGMLMPSERWENVQQAFRVRRRGWSAGKRILIIDDIVTSGATVSEMAKVLRADGARMVDVLCLARGGGGSR